jgi:leucyl/phenylalanyl-tRNA--protein transferase
MQRLDGNLWLLDHRPIFPPAARAGRSGILAVGGDLSVARLTAAYRQGIFPWFEAGDPIIWWSPDPRFVLFTREFHLPRSLARTIRRGGYRVTFDAAFDRVVDACAAVERPGQRGTWITREMAGAYKDLHRAGMAHSTEAWRGDELVGGLYGVDAGPVFSGESMFAAAPDASKVAFAATIGMLAARGTELVDCQMETVHLARFGARFIPRAQFLAILGEEPRVSG